MKFDELNDEARYERSLIELRRLAWSSGLSDEAIRDIADAGEYVQLEDGDVVHRAEEQLTAVVFVVNGRLLATAMDLFGKKVLQKYLVRGSAFGLFSVANPDQATSDVVAIEPSTVIRLPTERLLELVAKHADLQMNLYRLAGTLVRQIVMLDRKKSQPSAVGVVHQCEESRPLTPRLVRRLKEIEDPPCVAGDDSDWQEIEDVPYRLVFENGQLIPEDRRRVLLKSWAERGRIFIDVSADRDLEDISRLMAFVEVVLWCVRPSNAHHAIRTLHALQSKVPGWRDKIRLVWMLDDTSSCSPHLPELCELVQSDFKISLSPPSNMPGTLLQRGIERIVHHLRGVQIGLALGGGAARGMAHLGVLKVLEQNGIYVDMIAGTSAGAMTGTIYASGMTADEAVESFKTDLKVPWAFRCLPAGGYWYLMYKYRRLQFDPMLRNYLRDYRQEQLPLPMLTVTVDLVSGEPVVRETGDATRNILESINLPGLSSPIIGEGKALVDGGLVNNIPADVLVGKGCNFVLASSVTAKLEREFVGIKPDEPMQKHASPSFLKVLMRGYLVQSYNMNGIGVQPADLVIEPDVTDFDLSEFERADEMAVVGEEAAAGSLNQIKRLLSRLDPQLFN